MRGLEKEYSGQIEFVHANILNPETESLQEQYGFSTTPEFYLVDAQGEIIAFWDDSVDVDRLRLAFEQALGKE
ncbi:MAG TPA: hypothetical protein VLA49_03485 [Anaerolineales bacterium]|nr:hypothetical protein [Anaerolineales bacterium]